MEMLPYENTSGLRAGSMTISCNACFAVSWPAFALEIMKQIFRNKHTADRKKICHTHFINIIRLHQQSQSSTEWLNNCC